MLGSKGSLCYIDYIFNWIMRSKVSMCYIWLHHQLHASWSIKIWGWHYISITPHGVEKGSLFFTFIPDMPSLISTKKKTTYKRSYIDSFILWCLLIHTKCIYANKKHLFWYRSIWLFSVYILSIITLYDLTFRTFWFLCWSYTEPLLCYDSLWWFVTVVAN